MTDDREHLARVRARVHDAVAELHELRCADPAAASAVHVVKLTQQTLECWWIPMLDRATR